MENVQAKRCLEFSSDESVEITIAPNAGACFGVVRAIKLARQAAERNLETGDKVYCLGPLIHNPRVVNELSSRGVETVTQVDEVREGSVILRSHGVQKEKEAELRSRGVQIIDATCPLVKKPQRIAAGFGAKGYFLIMVGDLNHPEVKGVLSYFGSDRYRVTYDASEVDLIPEEVGPVGILAQTTIEARVLDEVIRRARARFSEVIVSNTICEATSVRQSEAVMLAQRADVLVVVGGKNSSNTNKLVKICKDYQKNTHHIEELDEIDLRWFEGKRKIGVTGGASTPHEVVDNVGNHIAKLLQN